jgi:KaiC/GvpD/RAD55 family RecA-like ATPase
MLPINHDKIPVDLKCLPQWVLWKTIERGGKPTKVPYQVNGDEAKSNDPATWDRFEFVLDRYERGGYDGVGFVFAECGGLAGVDLDGCRDPATGKVADWAREIIAKLDTYAEVSPSMTGVKLFLRGASPFQTGKKKQVPGADAMGGKEPAIEVYDHGRYFAVTGIRMAGPTSPQTRQDALQWLASKYWQKESLTSQASFYGDDAVSERARRYLAKLPPAIAGQGGHNAAFRAACVLVLGFGMARETALKLMREWNQTCEPPWSERELEHKVDSAAQQTGPRNYLRNVQPERWDSVRVPEYRPAPEKPQPRVTTLADAARKYIAKLENGGEQLVTLGIPDLDSSLGGGLEAGEIAILAARPSHGKSAVAMQIVHNWTSIGIPTLIISEEMSSLLLGKRTLQFASDSPQEYWDTSIESLKKDIDRYAKDRSQCFVLESCRTVDVVIEQIDKYVAEHKIQAVVIDYIQLLQGKGKSRYEEVTNTSIAIKQAVSRHGLTTLILAQLNRALEHRPKYIPIMSDLRETGQLEQDADVIVFLVWPHRLDSTKPAHEYTLFVAKNRNRGIAQPVVKCKFLPSRQMLVKDEPEPPPVQDHWTEFDKFAGGVDGDW